MAVSYKKLWKLLIDKDIKKKDLSAMAGVSPATITKMGKGGHVTTEVLLKICTALNCGIDDIMEIIPAETAANPKQSFNRQRKYIELEGNGICVPLQILKSKDCKTWEFVSFVGEEDQWIFYPHVAIDEKNETVYLAYEDVRRHYLNKYSFAELGIV